MTLYRRAAATWDTPTGWQHEDQFAGRLMAPAARRGWYVDRDGVSAVTDEGLVAVDGPLGGDLGTSSPLLQFLVADQYGAWPGRSRAARLRWAEGIDPERPSPSRVYDALLGGAHNFAVDRDLARQLLAAEPRAGEYARANRAFLHRAVRFLLAAGVRQFLDLGSGMPTVGNVHEAAQRVRPDARVVYVDVDPVAITHAQQLLAGNDRAAAIREDLRYPEAVLRRLVDEQLLEPGEPVGLLMVAVLHFVPDADDPAQIVARYRHLLAPGSYLVISHACPPPVSAPHGTRALDTYRATTADLTLRRPDEVRPLFAGWELLPPGLVEVNRWRPDEVDAEHAAAVPGVAGVGYLPTGRRSGCAATGAAPAGPSLLVPGRLQTTDIQT